MKTKGPVEVQTLELDSFEKYLRTMDPSLPEYHLIIYHLRSLLGIFEQTSVGVETTSAYRSLIELGSR